MKTAMRNRGLEPNFRFFPEKQGGDSFGGSFSGEKPACRRQKRGKTGLCRVFRADVPVHNILKTWSEAVKAVGEEIELVKHIASFQNILELGFH